MNSLAFILTAVAYLCCIAALGYRGYRKTVSSQYYLLAGRSAHPFVMAMSYGAAFISTSAIVGFGGVAGRYGMGLQWLVFMNIAVGIFIAFVFFGLRTRRIGKLLGSATFPQFIADRFESPKMRIFLAAVIFVFMPVYSSVVLIGGARFLEETLSLDYTWALILFGSVVAIYVFFGGLKGVMYVDALMGSVMILGLGSLLVMSYWKLGGVTEAHKQLTALAPLVAERLPQEAALGHAGWTVMPKFNSVWWWTLVSSLMLGVGIGALAQPQLAVRFMTVKSSRELHRATVIGAIFIFLTVGSAYLVGALSNVFFYYQQSGGLAGLSGKLAIEAAEGNQDRIIPLFISRALPPVILYIFVLTLLSAAMSTLSSLFHVTGSTIGHDLIGGLSGKDSVALNRAGVIAGIVICIGLGYALPPGIIARGTAIFFGICAAAFLPAYVAALYWKRATAAGVWASMITGVAASCFGLAFLHKSESAALGICKMLTGKTELVSSFPWPFVDPMLYALPLSALALVAVSLVTEAPSQKLLAKCFKSRR